MTGIWSEQTAIRIPLVLMGLGAIGAGAALVLAMGAAIQRAAFEGGVSAAQVAAVHFSHVLEGHAKTVAELAEMAGAAGASPARAELLRSWLSLHEEVFTALAIFEGGSLSWVETRQGGAGQVLGPAAAELARRALLRRSPVARVGERGDGRGPWVLLATPTPGGGGDTTAAMGALIACFEVERLSGAPLDALARDGQAGAFLATGDGRVVLARTPADGLAGRGEGYALAFEDLESLTLAAAMEGRATRVLASSGRTVLGVAVRFDAVGSAWVVGVTHPWRMSFAKADRFLLLAGLGALVLLAGVVGVAVGVHRLQGQQKREEEEVRRWRATADAARQDAWRRALLSMPGFPVMELQGTRIVEANARAARYLGVGSAAALEGRDFLELVTSGDREPLARFLGQEQSAKADDEGLTVSLEVVGGGRRVADLRRLPSFAAQGRTVLISWRDGTGRERGEALARTMAAVMPVPIVFVDASGALVWSNPACAETARRLGVKVSTDSIMEVFRPAHRRLVRVMFAAALRGKSSEKLVPLAVGGGEALAVVLRAAPVQVAGQVFGVVFAGQELRGAPPGAVVLDPQRRAEALARLAAGLSHRLNNDIQSLQGLISDARVRAGGTVRAEDFVSRLEAAARELQRFVGVCRRSGAALRRARLSVLLDRWRTSRAPQLPPGVRLVLNSDVTEDRVTVDARQIESFLDYALSATVGVLQGGGGAVAVAVERGQTPGTVRLSVRDTGGEETGGGTIARDDLPGSMARDAMLAVAQLVAERHGGAAGWKSPAGMGAYVWLDLPLTPGAVMEEEPRVVKERRQGVVMVADDEEMVRTSLAAALREAGFIVEEASHGGEVLERILAAPGRYAVLVLDLVMPVVDGREVYRRISREVPTLPVLLCTGYDLDGGEELAGAAVIVKPCPLDVFVERVRSLTNPPAATVIG